MYELMNVYPFRPLCFGVTCYAAIDEQNTQQIYHHYSYKALPNFELKSIFS